LTTKLLYHNNKEAAAGTPAMATIEGSTDDGDDAFVTSSHDDATPPNSMGNTDEATRAIPSPVSVSRCGGAEVKTVYVSPYPSVEPKDAIPASNSYNGASDEAAPSRAGEGVPFSDNSVIEGATNATTIEEHLSPHSIPGVMFVPGPGFRGGIHTGYHSAQESDHDDVDDDIENQIFIEGAYTVPDDNEQTEIIEKLHEQLGSAQQELQVAKSQLAASIVEVDGEVVPDDMSDSNNKRKTSTFVFILCLGAIAIAVSMGLAVSFSNRSDTTGDETFKVVAQVLPPVLKAAQKRGILRCGVQEHDSLGFIAFNNKTNEREGFEVDLCKAVAAAALGSSYRYELVPTTGLNRFVTLAGGEIDVLIASTTHTFDRDVHELSAGIGFSFSSPYLYDGMTFNGVPEFVTCADKLSAVEDCTGILICSIIGTTWHDKTKELFPSSNLVIVEDQVESIQNLIEGKCNIIQGGQYDAPEMIVRGYGYDGPYAQGKISFTKEPLAMVTRDDDPEFAAFVYKVLQVLLLAETQNVTMMTASTVSGTTEFFGVTNALTAVGNYGEVYTRHLSSISPRLEVNTINDGETTGLLYSYPLGKVDAVGPGPIKHGVIERILQRGFLRCGIRLHHHYPADLGGGQGTSFDKTDLLNMELCRALTASLFQRIPDNTSFQRYSEDDDIFLALENGDIDVYAGGEGDLYSDVFTPGLSFSRPYFYERVKALSLATLKADTQWSDFVYWITMAPIYAEENGITQETSDDMPLVNLFGTDLERILRHAIHAVGNYDEMYRRVLGQNSTRAGLNTLNVFPYGPQYYPLPCVLGNNCSY